jgi:hypothetical protein
MLDTGVVKGRFSAHHRYKAHDTFKCGCFAGTIATEQNRNFTGADFQAQIEYDLGLTIKCVDGF